MSEIKCPVLSDSDKNKIKGIAEQLKFKTNNAEIEAAVTNLVNLEKGLTIDVLLDGGQSWRIIGAIREVQANAEASTMKGRKIGNATVKIGDNKKYVDKIKVANDTKTLYVFEDSAQARETLTGESTGIEGVEIIEDETIKSNMLNKSNNSSNARTDINGNILPNAKGILVNKNTRTASKENSPEGISEKDEAAVLETIKKDLQNIKATLEDGEYSSVMFPKVIKGDMSRSLAEGVASLLWNELGIKVADIRPTYSKSQKYEIVLQEVKELSPKKERELEKLTEAKLSLKAERPVTTETEVNERGIDVLQRTFPDIHKRKARIDFISSMFSESLTEYLDNLIYELENMSEEELGYSFDGGYLTNGEVLSNLKKGDERAKRLYALKNLTEDNKDLFSVILDDIYTRINNVADSEIDEIADMLLNSEEPMGERFLGEAMSKNWGTIDENGVPSKKLLRKAKSRALTLKEAFSKMRDADVFVSLVSETRYDLELNEGIVLSGDVTVRDNKEVDTKFNIVSGTQEDSDNSELDESNLNLGKMDFVTKYKLINPRDTLSARMKKLLGSLYKIARDKYGNTHIVYNDLGMPIKLNPGVVYYIILDRMSGITSIEDMDTRLTSMQLTYPWMSSIIERITPVKGAEDNFDMDLRKEFYRAVNKTYVQFGFVSRDGNLVKCNMKNSSEVMYDTISKNYEGGNVLGPESIYDDYGNPVEIHIKTLKDLLTNTNKTKGSEVIFLQQHPLFTASVILQNPLRFSSKKFTPKEGIERINTALKLLRGEEVEVSDGKGMVTIKSPVSLDALLRDLGIDTSNINLDELLPEFDTEYTEYTMNARTGDILAVTEQGNIPVFTKTQSNILVNVLDLAANIVSTFKEGTPLVHSCKNYYLALSSSLAMLSDGFTQATFRFGDTNRYSYSVPSFIDRMVSNISNDDNSIALEFIDDNYGGFDFFQDKSGRYNNVWLRMMTDVNSVLAEKLRRNFEVMQVLGFKGSKEKNTIQNVSKNDLKEGVVDMFFSANDAEGIHYAYFRNPLFSDTDAMCFFKFRRFTSGTEILEDGTLVTDFDFKNKIVSELVNVLKQDVERVKDLRSNPNGQDIEFYNEGKENGKKLVFFPEFNKDIEVEIDGIVIRGLDDILEYTTRMDNEDPNDYNDRVEAFYHKLISDRLAELSQAFVDSFSEDYKIKLYNKEQKRAGANIIEEKSAEEAIQEESKDDDIIIDDEEEEEQVDTEREAKIQYANTMLEEFYYNDFLAQSQLIQLLGGDLAMYKNFGDFVKRNKQAFASGERLYYKDDEGNILSDTGIYLEDMIRASNTLESLQELLDSDTSISEMDKAVIRGAFVGINTTDGQTLRTMTSFRKLLQAMGGKWTDNMEAAYRRIESGQISAEDFMTLWQPIKPFLFSFETRMVNGRVEKVVTQHKNSEYLLSAVYNLLNTALNKKSPLLKGLNKFMNEHNIDAAHFHSVVKEGYNNSIDLNYDPRRFEAAKENGKIKVGNLEIEAPSYEVFFKKLTSALKKEQISPKEYNDIIDRIEFQDENAVYERLQELLYASEEEKASRDPEEQLPHESLSSEMIHTFPLSDYMVVQPTDDHLTDTVAKFGSQLRNIIPADLPDTFTMTVTIGNKSKTLNREEAVKYYNELFVEKLIRAFSKINKEFSSSEAIRDMLQAKMKQQPSKYPPDMQRALELDSTGTRFNIPLNSPNLKNKIEDLILSEFKNHLQKQTIKGGNAVLVSNFGLHKDLHVVYKTDDKGRKTVDYIEVYLTHTMSSQLKDFLKPGKDGVQLLDYDTMYKKLGKEKADKLLKAIGYRIPTEDKYSIFPIKIMGFMPAIAGCTIMMPSDIVEMSGTDFDIDKLFLMLLSVIRTTHSGDLVGAYKQWLDETGYNDDGTVEGLVNSLAELFGYKSETMNEVSKAGSKDNILGKLKRFRETGFTEEQVGSFMQESETFALFMEQRGFNYQYDTPHYDIIQPTEQIDDNGELDLSGTISQSSDSAIDNMIIDFVFNTLTSHEGSQLMMRQGTFRDVKHSSRIERIINNKGALAAFQYKYENLIESKGSLYEALKSLSTDDLDDFYSEYATPQSPMDVMMWIDTHRNLMDGNDLIGMFAVNSSSHYKLQFANITIKKANAIKIKLANKDMELMKVDDVISSINKKRIGEICAQFQAASPDNGKDPCLGDLNISPETVDVVNLLSRLGLDITDIGAIVDSEKVQKFVLPSDVSIEIEDPSAFYLDVDKLMETKALITMEKYDDIDLNFVVNFKIWYNNLKKVAADLSSISPVIRSDSPNGALSTDYATAIQQILKIDKLRADMSDGEFSINGLDKIVAFDIDASQYKQKELKSLFMESPIPRLQAVFSLSFDSAFPIVEKVLPDFSKASIDRLRMFMEETGVPLYYKKHASTIKQLITEYNMFLLTRTSLFNNPEGKKELMNLRNYYLHDFPIKFKGLLSLKNEDGSYKYQNIKNLPAIARLSNKNDKGIKMDNIGKISPEVRKWYTEAFDQLTNMPDNVGEEERKVAEQLAVDLFMYGFFDNGLTFRHNSFSNFFSSTFLQNIRGVIDAYREIENVSRMSDDALDSRFIYQFMINHPALVSQLSRKMRKLEDEGSTLVVLKDEQGFYPNNVQTKSGNAYKEIIRTKELKYDNKTKTKRYVDVLWRRAEDPVRGRLVYKRLEANTKETLYYDGNVDYTDIKYGDIKSRGDARVKVDKLLKPVKSDKKPMPKGNDDITDNFNSDDSFEPSAAKINDGDFSISGKMLNFTDNYDNISISPEAATETWAITRYGKPVDPNGSFIYSAAKYFSDRQSKEENIKSNPKLDELDDGENNLCKPK